MSQSVCERVLVHVSVDMCGRGHRDVIAHYCNQGSASRSGKCRYAQMTQAEGWLPLCSPGPVKERDFSGV